MPWAIFHRPFEYDHRPHKAVCQVIKVSETPQAWPEKIIAAAVAAGCAERVELSGDEIRELRRAERG
jgi:hypothetical protein